MRLIYRPVAIFLAMNNLFFIFHIIMWFVIGARRKSSGFNVLAINTKRFRGDLEILEENGLTVYRIPFHWQQRLLLFYSHEDYKLKGFTHNDTISSKRNSQIGFLVAVLSKIITRYDIGAVIGPGTYYKQDYDYMAATKVIGIPYLVLNRENLVIKPNTEQYTKDIVREIFKNKYKPDAIFFHNNKILDIYKEAGFDEVDLYNYGAIRMKQFYDNYIAREDIRAPNSKNKIVLFSFYPCEGLRNTCTKEHGFYALFESVHNAIYELSIENPDIDFVIKSRWGGNQVDKITSVLPIDELPHNLEIVSEECNAHDLMLDAAVVSGFNSTTMIESSAIGIPVVYPMFDEAQLESYSQYLLYNEIRSCFHVVRSKEEYKRSLINLIGMYDKNKHTVAINSFEENVYSGKANKCILEIKKYIHEVV